MLSYLGYHTKIKAIKAFFAFHLTIDNQCVHVMMYICGT